MSYDDWMGYIDACMFGWVGVTHSDIADQTWRDWFDAGMAPVNAAAQALANEGI